MKRICIAVISVMTIALTACNSASDKQANQDMTEKKKDSASHATINDDKEIKAVTVAYTDVDAKAAVVLKEIVDHYLHIKNALANDNAGEAAGGGKAMEKAIRGLDKSLLTSAQKKVYDDIEDDLEEHAEHIGQNGDNIKHQREHFSMMSEDVYDLVKAFGGGQAIYHDHCPMYKEGKGAMWLSETKEIKNPYYGNEMPRCGTVEEVIK